MSTLKVPVAVVEEVLPHPNADRLRVLVVGGYQTCTAEDYAVGDRVIYVPPDAVLPDEVAERWGIKPYLGTGNRVKTVRLRGFVSRGFVVPDETGLVVGTDVAGRFGITKYEPPEPEAGTDFEPQHADFLHYTEIERIQNYPNVFRPGEEVVITEKIHGTNSRCALLLDTETGEQRFICGTRRNQVKCGSGSKYELPLQREAVRGLLLHAAEGPANVTAAILFGEIYGPKVQKHFGYGVEGSEGYAAFDLGLVDAGLMTFVGYEYLYYMLAQHGITGAPELYRGPYAREIVDELADGPSMFGPDHIREGVVVRPLRERQDLELGRVILKRIGDNYEVGQYDWTDSH